MANLLKPKLKRLKNGLRLIILPIRGIKTATCLLMVYTGSRNENKKNNGISHFLEHMFFKGTETRPHSEDITSILDGIGAEFNAFTSKEYTGFYIKVYSVHLDTALEVLSDMLIHPLLKEEEIEKEKGAVIAEMNLYMDTPAAYVKDLFDQMLYPDDPAGFLTLGSKETVSALSRDDLSNYLKNNYTSKNSLLVLAGDIAKKESLEKAQRYFSDYRIGKSLKYRPVKELQIEPKTLAHFKKTDQTHLNLGFRGGCDCYNEKLSALEILSIILGGYMSSRMWLAVRERRGLAYYLSTDAESFSDHGFLVTRAGVHNEKVEEAIHAILDEYRIIRQDLLKEEELKRAKEYYKAKLFMNLESSRDTALWFGAECVVKKKLPSLEKKIGLIDSVTVSDIKAIANEVIKQENLNFAMIGPHEDKESFDKLMKL